MTKRIFFDCDGTLVDSSQRLYQLFIELAPECRFSYDEYWKIKRARITQRDLLRKYYQYSDEKIDLFHKRWMEQVEEEPRLTLDQPFPGVGALLQKLAGSHELYLVTARQYPQRVKQQIASFGWKDVFTEIFVTQQQQSKAAYLQTRIDCQPGDLLVGDTGEDILAGKELGMKTIAVTSGILSREVLQEYQPDDILDTVVQIHAD